MNIIIKIWKRNKGTRCVWFMQVLKYFMLLLIFISSSLIGKIISKKYSYRLEELEEIRNILNVFKSKIKFTYETIPEIFKEISNKTKNNIAVIFKSARRKYVIS